MIPKSGSLIISLCKFKFVAQNQFIDWLTITTWINQTGMRQVLEKKKNQSQSCDKSDNSGDSG